MLLIDSFLLTNEKKVIKALDLETTSSDFLMERDSVMVWFYFVFGFVKVEVKGFSRFVLCCVRF